MGTPAKQGEVPLPAPPRGVERWPYTRSGLTIAAIMLAGMALWLGGKMHGAVRDSLDPKGNDYGIFVASGETVLRGEEVIGLTIGTRGRRFFCHPWFAVVMVPFGLMGTSAASFAWPLTNLALLAASAWCCMKVIRGADAPVPWPLLIVPMALVGRALDSNFGLGQINVLILGAVSLGLYLYARGRGFAAGLLLSAGALVKLHPGLLCAYFLWKREWRVVAGACVAGVVLLFLVPMPFYGPAGGIDSTRRWLEQSIFGSAKSIGEDGYVVGQSLRPISYRFLTDSVANSHANEDVRVNIADISTGKAEAIYKAAAILMLLAVVAVTWGKGDRANVERTAAELSLVCIAMLMAAPFTRKAHFVLLMLPMAFAYSRLALHGVKSARDRVLLVATVACALLTVMTTPGILGDKVADYLTGLTCMGWGALALFIGILGVLPELPVADGRAVRQAEPPAAV